MNKTRKEKEIELSSQLQISKKELELVFDAIPEQICIIDRDYYIVRANKSYAEFVKNSVKNIVGKQCFHALWGDTCRCDFCPVKRTFEQGTSQIRKKFSREIGGETKHFEISAFPVFNDAGETEHAIELTKDITDEKRMIEQLIRSEKLASIGNMTAGIAHEMNNPLSGISGNATNLLKMPQKYGLNEKGISRITAILEASARATVIMSDLLHLSDRKDQNSIMINLNALLVKTANAVHINGSQDIERCFNLADNLPPMQCDPSKIQQVIIHIVTNAMQSVLDKKKASPVGNTSFHGKLTITTQRQHREVLVAITDNGIGIPNENQLKIFDPFFSTKPTGQGTGLGLSVSHKIIEEHGGRIFFESVGGKTIFSIMLPIDSGSDDAQIHIEEVRRQ